MEWQPCASRIGPGEDGVLSRFGHSCVVVDATHTWGTELAIVFGGVMQSAAPSTVGQLPLQHVPEQHHAVKDVLVLTGDGDSWFRPKLQGSQPQARAFHAAAVVGSTMYIFGGHVLQSEDDSNRKRRLFFNDLWALDTVGGWGQESWTWRLVPTTGIPEVPPRRDMATLTPVGSDALLLFGGRNEQGRTLSDAWLYDITKCQWHHLRPGGVHPPPRKMHAAVHVNGRVLVFGGERDNGVLDDLWSLKLPQAPLAEWLPQHLAQQAAQGGAPLLVHGPGQGDELCRWTQIRVRPSPPARFGHSLCVTGSGRLLLMFGGCLDTAGFLALTHSFVQCSETWVLDLASFSWRKESPSVLGMPALPATTAEDVSLFGGGEGGGVLAKQNSFVVSGPVERMCHTMTALSDGRLLLVGGRRKEGICKDGWWLHIEAPHAVPGAPDIAQGHKQGTHSFIPGTTSTTPPPPPTASTTSSAPALLKSLFNPSANKLPPTATPPPPTTFTATSTPPGSSTNLLDISPSPPTQSTPRHSTSGLAASAATAAVNKLAGLLGMAGDSSSPADDTSMRYAAHSTPSTTAGGTPSTTTQLLGKLNALKAALPWQQQEQPPPPPPPPASWVPQTLPSHTQQQWGMGAAGSTGVVAGPGGGGYMSRGHSLALGPQGSIMGSVQSFDLSTALAVQAAAEAAEYERFREVVLHLPPTPQPALGSVQPRYSVTTNSGGGLQPQQPPRDVQAVQGLLEGRGQQLAGHRTSVSSREAVALTRSHLQTLDADQVTLSDLELIMRDFHGLLQSRDVAQESQPVQGVQGLLAVVQAGALSSASLVAAWMAGDEHGVRVSDVAGVIRDYRELCGSVQVA